MRSTNSPTTAASTRTACARIRPTSISCRSSSLGAASPDYKPRRLYDGIEMGALAMDAYRFDPA
jgi:hypothetical protein